MVKEDVDFSTPVLTNEMLEEIYGPYAKEMEKKLAFLVPELASRMHNLELRQSVLVCGNFLIADTFRILSKAFGLKISEDMLLVKGGICALIQGLLTFYPLNNELQAAMVKDILKDVEKVLMMNLNQCGFLNRKLN